MFKRLSIQMEILIKAKSRMGNEMVKEKWSLKMAKVMKEIGRMIECMGRVSILGSQERLSMREHTKTVNDMGKENGSGIVIGMKANTRTINGKDMVSTGPVENFSMRVPIKMVKCTDQENTPSKMVRDTKGNLWIIVGMVSVSYLIP